MASIYYADYYAKKTFDRHLFISILEQTLATQADITPELTLLNTVAHQRATELLAQADDFF